MKARLGHGFGSTQTQRTRASLDLKSNGFFTVSDTQPCHGSMLARKASETKKNWHQGNRPARFKLLGAARCNVGATRNKFKKHTRRLSMNYGVSGKAYYHPLFLLDMVDLLL